MNKAKIKRIIKALRKEAKGLVKKYNNYNIHISISLEAVGGEVMDVNPYSLDLRTGIYFGRDLIDETYKTVRLWE